MGKSTLAGMSKSLAIFLKDKPVFNIPMYF
jgi:hypothetical protein